MHNATVPIVPAHPDGAAELPKPVEALSIAELRAGYGAGQFRPTDVVRASVARISAFEPLLNAFVVLSDRLVADARAADRALEDGSDLGPLHGIPVVIKDSMNEAGSRTTAGYAGFASDDQVLDPAQGVFNGVDLVPVSDATLVASLKRSGALIIGRANLSDFALGSVRANSSHSGETLNPYSASFAPGGSSTGSAAAVAAGFAFAGLGTDTAGSILIPAAAQSLVGIKPTFGLVPIDGVFPGLPTHHDVVGPIARTVRDAAEVLEVLAGGRGEPVHARPRDEVTPPARRYGAVIRGSLRGTRIGLFEPGQWGGPLQQAVADHYERMADVLRSLGAETVEVVFSDTDWRDRWAERPFFMHSHAYLDGVDQFLASLGGDNPGSREQFRQQAGFEIGIGSTAPLWPLFADPDTNVSSSDPRIAEVIGAAQDLYQHYVRILDDKGVDALFLPRATTPLPDISASPMEVIARQVSSTEVNELGLPAIAIPAGFLGDGRPIAVDFVGRARFSDAEIISLAYDFEQATQLRVPPKL